MTTTGSWKICIPLAAALSFQGAGLAAESRFEIDLKELPKAAAPPAKHAAPAHAPKPARGPAKKAVSDGTGTARYTVKQGDHIFKILMRDFGLSNRQAELLIPNISRMNGISDIRRLRVGQELLIPLTPSARSARKPEPKAMAASAAPLPTETPPAEPPSPPVTAPSPPVQEPAAPVIVPQKPEPVAEAPRQTAPPVPEKPLVVSVCPVAGTERDQIIDAVLDLLAPGWVRNRIVEGGKESTDGSYVSIKVDRYFEYLGYRYIVNSQSDPLTLTLLRLLEVQGDRVVNIGRDDGAAVIAARLAAKMELPQEAGSFRVRCLDSRGSEVTVHGIRVSTAGPYGRQLLITGDAAPKCSAELLAAAETAPAVK